MAAFDLSGVTPLLALFAPAATLIGAWVTLNYNRRQRLSDRLGALFSEENKTALRSIQESDRIALVSEQAKAKPALKVLLQFHQVANSVSQSPRHWDHALTHDDLQLLRNAVERASLLIQVVRYTGWDFELKAWNGSRRNAFAALLKACSVKLPENR